MDFAARKARADDGRADDDLGTCLTIVNSSTGCMRAMASETNGATDDFASSVADFVNTFFVGRFRMRCDNELSNMAVAEKEKATMSDGVVVAQLSEQRSRRTTKPDNWRTTENSPIRHAESL